MVKPSGTYTGTKTEFIDEVKLTLKIKETSYSGSDVKGTASLSVTCKSNACFLGLCSPCIGPFPLYADISFTIDHKTLEATVNPSVDWSKITNYLSDPSIKYSPADQTFTVSGNVSVGNLSVMLQK
mgnify:CR=1 FL=1